jgi:hypothetical protein
MLRPELHSFYADQVDKIRERYGEFILVNTNFNHVNAFFPAQNLFRPNKHSGEKPQFGKAGVGMTREFAEALHDHKQRIFEAFQRLIPTLARTFPRFSIVVRPHPTEAQDVYRRIAEDHDRIHVTNEGNVVSWLLAAKALVHNGCTTGVEAFVMRIPAISFRPVVTAQIDDGFYVLPHGLSHQAFTEDELLAMLQMVADGNLGAADGSEHQELVRRYLTGQDGPLACERMVAVLETISATSLKPITPGLTGRWLGTLMANGRFAIKRIKSLVPGSHAPPEFHRHRYPDITLPQIQHRIRRFQEILGDTTPIASEKIPEQIFRIHPS